MTSVIEPDLCRNCGSCLPVCRQNCIFQQEGHYRVEQYDCIDCAACREVCPTGAAMIDG